MDLSFEMKTVALLFAVQKSCGQNLVFDAANLSILSGFHGHMIDLSIQIASSYFLDKKDKN